MIGICEEQRTFAPREVLVGLLQYIQRCYPVLDFPPSNHSAWKELVCRITTDPQLRKFLPKNFDVRSVLDDVTILNTATGRIRPDPKDQQGDFFAKFFWRDIHRIYEMALETRELITFN